MAGTGKGRFVVPSLKEMEKMDDRRPAQGMSRFAAHQLSKTSPQKSKNSDEQPGTSRAASICTSIQHHGSTASSSVPKGKDNSSGSTTTREGNTQKSSGIQSQSSLPDFRSNLVSTESRVQTTTSTTGQTPALKEASAEGISVAGKSSSKTNSLIVNTRQKGNPIIKHIRNVLWEFGDIVPDYVMGQTTCALFLSLRYHALNPNYIHERFKQLGHSYALRVLLVQVDTKDPQHALRHLAKVCILADCTLILAWTPEEAGRYLETYKSFEVKPPDLIMEKTDSNYMSQLTDTLTAVKKVNKTDAMTLLTAFGSFEKIAEASEEDMSLCPGFGPQKAKRLHSAFHEPFISVKKSKTQESAAPAEKVAASPRKKKTDLS